MILDISSLLPRLFEPEICLKFHFLEASLLAMIVPPFDNMLSGGQLFVQYGKEDRIRCKKYNLPKEERLPPFGLS